MITLERVRKLRDEPVSKDPELVMLVATTASKCTMPRAKIVKDATYRKLVGMGFTGRS